jgi:hypothetical protein
MHLAVNTRPDILHAVVRLSQYSNCYNEELWKHAKRVLRYLKQTKHFCLTFKKSKLPRLVGHVDADWGGDSVDRRSYLGFVFKYGDSVVSWSSRKQKSVSLSNTESEYIALSEATKEAVYLNTMLAVLLQLKRPETYYVQWQSRGSRISQKCHV